MAIKKIEFEYHMRNKLKDFIKNHNKNGKDINYIQLMKYIWEEAQKEMINVLYHEFKDRSIIVRMDSTIEKLPEEELLKILDKIGFIGKDTSKGGQLSAYKTYYTRKT